ncbi:MAG: CZB domain-containing protein [Pseudomonadota bacterium]
MSCHIVWKRRVLRALEGQSGEYLDRAIIGRDDLCQLGKWIYGEGLRYGQTDEYRTVKTVHAELHVLVAEAIGEMDGGDRPAALKIMAGPVEAASRGIIHALAGLRTKLEGSEDDANKAARDPGPERS